MHGAHVKPGVCGIGFYGLGVMCKVVYLHGQFAEYGGSFCQHPGRVGMASNLQRGWWSQPKAMNCLRWYRFLLQAATWLWVS